ncbi:MAG: AAA family ATPase [Chloroflexi bacterium]|nr:AAA family ATPase [Chloroflexota bacterium]
MFFGRENELRQIRDHLSHQSFAITGGRRIGKTSIAQRLLKEYLPAANFYALYQDISFISNPEQFLATKLTNWQPIGPAEAPATVGDLLAAPSLDRPVVLLLDEADKLMPIDRKLGWPVFNYLRAAANSGHLRVILIGERQLRESMQDAHSPLFNFVSDILVGRLNFENVEKLITQPLEKLEIIYDPAIVRRIYEFTSGHPNIVQRLCYQLIERLDTRNDPKLTLNDVEAVVNDPGFQQDDFLNTYLSQATLLEYILTITLSKAGQSFYNLADIRQLLQQQFSLTPSAREINAALRRLVELRSILTHTECCCCWCIGRVQGAG